MMSTVSTMAMVVMSVDPVLPGKSVPLRRVVLLLVIWVDLRVRVEDTV